VLHVTTSPELDFASVVVAPGDTETTSLTVRNDSEIVEAYTFEVVGPCAPWTEVEPERLSLYPGTSGTVTVRLSPPRSPSVRAGEQPLAVRVLPAERPELVTVPETTVTIQPYGQLDAALEPQRRRTWWRGGRFTVRLGNQGNDPIDVALDAADAGQELRYRGVPSHTALEPGEEAEVRLLARKTRPIWFGKSVTTPFHVLATPTNDPPLDPGVRELDGELVQMAVLPRWLLALLALLLALLLFWLTLVGPAVNSTARQAADDAVKQQVQSGQLAPGPSNTNAPKGQQGGGGQQGGTGGGGQPVSSGGAGQQSSATIEVHTAGGGHDTQAYTVPPKKVFFVTDLVLANFQGDVGVLTVSFGNQVITTIALETFRNQDYHWVTPIEVPAGAGHTGDRAASHQLHRGAQRQRRTVRSAEVTARSGSAFPRPPAPARHSQASERAGRDGRRRVAGFPPTKARRCADRVRTSSRIRSTPSWAGRRAPPGGAAAWSQTRPHRHTAGRPDRTRFRLRCSGYQHLLVWVHHLHSRLAVLAVPGHRDRPRLTSRGRVGHRGSPAHRCGRTACLGSRVMVPLVSKTAPRPDKYICSYLVYVCSYEGGHPSRRRAPAS
jgi:hypothetical protein